MTVGKQILDQIGKTHPISSSVMDILKLTAKEDHSLVDLVKIVENDSVLTAKMLKVANSAAVATANVVDTVQIAVSLLGERMVVGTALETCTNHFFDKPLQGYESEAGDLWRHSLKTAIAARFLAKYAKKNLNPNLAFTAGILHDIGKTVISAFLQGNTELLVGVTQKDRQISFNEAERMKLGTDHCEVGGALAAEWKLPDYYQEVIRYHHTPDNKSVTNPQLVYAVHMGDIIAMMCGSGTGADSMLYRLCPKYSEYFDLGPDAIPMLLLSVEEDFNDIQTSLQA